MSDKVPVTVLTGYLGAGKTTLLNRILSENHGKKYAVVVNEFGEIGIDNDLIVESDEEIYEMNNGCVCCTVRGDLVETLRELTEKRARGEVRRFSRVLIETTGLADPVPVAQTFFMDEDVRAKTKLDAIVTVVDAKHLPQRLADSHEAADQIAFADVIILNKTDLVTPAELEAVEKTIREINRFAVIHRTDHANVNVADLLDQHAFDLERVLARVPEFLTDDSHEHNDDVTGVSFAVTEDIDPEKFNAWIGALLAEKGPDLLRTKGILAYKGEDRRFAFQAVHMIADGGYIGPWRKGEKRESHIVFIGRNLNRPRLRRGFEACRA